MAFHKDKKVTLVHRAAALLNNSQPPMIEKFVKKVGERLKGMGVDVKLGTEVKDLPLVSNNDGFISGTREYTLSDRSKITADLLVICVAGPRTQRIVPAEWLDASGRVIVDSCLRVQGAPGVFCIGDANNVMESKLGYFAVLHAELTAANIRKLFKGSSALKPWAPATGNKEFGTMLLPLGSHVGVGALGKIILGDANTRLVKGKGLFTKKVFTDRNVPVPAGLF